jgi:flap endonuclease-1
MSSLKYLIIHQTRMSEKAEKAAKNAAKDSDPESEPDGGEEGEEGTSEPKKKKKRATGTGGVHVPDEWPWEEAKKIFMNPDVLKGDDVEVSR